MTDVLIKRELLERIDESAICDGTDATISDDLFTQLVAELAAPQPSAVPDEPYPPCDYCGKVPDYHPWHGSGLINGSESPHIHACNDCRHLLPSAPAPAGWVRVTELLQWAVDQWHREVSQRPLVNIHRRTLDDTWRQIIRRLGGDDIDLCGPTHDTLTAAPSEEGGDSHD